MIWPLARRSGAFRLAEVTPVCRDDEEDGADSEGDAAEEDHRSPSSGRDRVQREQGTGYCGQREADLGEPDAAVFGECEQSHARSLTAERLVVKRLVGWGPGA